MPVSAALLILGSMPALPLPDITPARLATESRTIDLGSAPYDWSRQQGPSAAGVQLSSNNTATCDTVMGQTNNGRDTVPDCRFD